MRSLIYILLFLISLSNTSCGQNTRTEREQDAVVVGGPCEGCESIYESPVPFENLAYADTISGFFEDADKMIISGTVYAKDGTTPVPDVILYFYHTDDKGYYSKKGGESGWGLRHGYLRGWMKTNSAGEYKFYTMRPAPYPNATEPAHVHMIIKEPGKSEYYIDDIVFEDDEYVDDDYRRRVGDLGGSGIISLEKDAAGIYSGKRDIILGKNISNYP